MTDELAWVFVKGGICRYGDVSKPLVVKDLMWGMTPLTYGQLGKPASGDLTLPATGINYYEAIEIAQGFGARLPFSVEWEWMASGEESRLYPWGSTDWTPSKANLKSSNIGEATSVGRFSEGATPDGVLDVAGNVWEWTCTKIANEGAFIRGGSYNSIPLYAQNKFLNAAPMELGSKGIGLRLVKDL